MGLINRRTITMLMRMMKGKAIDVVGRFDDVELVDVSHLGENFEYYSRFFLEGSERDISIKTSFF